MVLSITPQISFSTIEIYDLNVHTIYPFSSFPLVQDTRGSSPIMTQMFNNFSLRLLMGQWGASIRALLGTPQRNCWYTSNFASDHLIEIILIRMKMIRDFSIISIIFLSTELIGQLCNNINIVDIHNTKISNVYLMHM